MSVAVASVLLMERPGLNVTIRRIIGFGTDDLST